jgi:hypothetical protein
MFLKEHLILVGGPQKKLNQKRIKISKAKATFTGRSPRHTKVGHPEGTKPKPGVDIRAVKEEGHVMCEIILTKTGPYGKKGIRAVRVKRGAG